jgi:glucose-6-phosphate isomerase
MAYLNRELDLEVIKVRSALASKTNRGVTFGWGPRFLHSTGQFHKGGQQNGSFLQITGDSEKDLKIPGRDFTFHTLQMAQALGDGEALTSRNLPMLRIHLKNRKAGINEILEAISKL